MTMNSQQHECKNVLLYGNCEFQGRGCQYHHPLPAERPPVRSKSFSAASVHAPVFVPRAYTPTSSPLMGWASMPAPSTAYTNQPYDTYMHDAVSAPATLDGRRFGLAFVTAKTRSADNTGHNFLAAGTNYTPNGVQATRDSDQRGCKNVVIYGYCKFQDKGCRFYHPPPEAKPISRSESVLASAIHAPVFVPKTTTNSPYSPPSAHWDTETEMSQSSSSWDTDISGILSGQDSELSFTESEMDYPLDLSEMNVDQPSNNSVELLQLLYRVLLRKASRSALQNLQGSQAQVIVDYLYSVLLRPVLPTPRLRKHVLITLYKLCKASLLYPRCYILKDSITFCSHEGGGGFSDIHKGHLGGKEFCLKVVRLHQKSDTDALLKACSPNKQFHNPRPKLIHPNIVPFYGVYYVNTLRRQICLVSPWMHHGNVVEYLKRHTFVARAPLVLDVASGLEYLHSQDMIHSDLKGANILVNDLGKACITDFGLSLVHTDKTFAYTLASSDANGYSLRWAAPELLEDGARATLASDIWAFGCVCYEVMAGLLPFSDLSEMQVLRALITGIAPKRPNSVAVSSEADGIIWAQMERCCQVDPKSRPNCKQILFDLQSTGFSRDDSYEAQNGAMLERQLFWDAVRQGEDGLLDMTAVEQVLSELSQNCESELLDEVCGSD
ncbi:hypothetical protein D9756_011431 [Leucocoprinus leucothites]|uniref:Serine/threonine-protein kinase HT1 n=1 Tax=Leucocoprinus leucothites TaxID=201217 RepID=A0A8H5CN78_9AGAR|nr:hypothetical protein D9756_011431 [Leucoagaricus leucothites]